MKTFKCSKCGSALFLKTFKIIEYTGIPVQIENEIYLADFDNVELDEQTADNVFECPFCGHIEAKGISMQDFFDGTKKQKKAVNECKHIRKNVCCPNHVVVTFKEDEVI